MFRVGGFLLFEDQVTQLGQSLGVALTGLDRAIILNRIFKKSRLENVLHAFPLSYPQRSFGAHAAIIIATHTRDDPEATWARFDSFERTEIDAKVQAWLEKKGVEEPAFATVVDPFNKGY